jgi:hypothetical protein
MKTSIRLAALLITGAVFVGCDKKDTTTVTTPDGKTTTITTPAAPSAPDTSKVGSAINNAIDKADSAAKTEANKLQGQVPTTAPAIPGLGK